MQNRQKKLVLVRSSVRGKVEWRLTRQPRRGERVFSDHFRNHVLRTPRLLGSVSRPKSTWR